MVLQPVTYWGMYNECKCYANFKLVHGLDITAEALICFTERVFCFFTPIGGNTR